MILAAVSNPFLQFPGGAKWSIGFLAIFHTAVGSLAIGFAFVVTVLQIIAYRRRENRFDLLAKRVQLWHVCIYNIGTINAIGLVFALSGLYPQFWSQIFVHFFWTLIVEEALFFMLATTLTLHYFFWEEMWGHKKLHIFMGALLTPSFLLQFYIINGMGAFMLTPAFAEGQVSQWGGTAFLTGWDKLAFYNPSFLMLTLHRTAANFAYAGFVVAGICGFWLYRSQRPKLKALHENGGRVAFCVAFMSFLAIPVIGFFYAWVLKYHAKEAYDNLMVGRGDVVALGVDWWWLKHMIVAAMIGIGLAFYRKVAREKQPFAIPMALIYTIAVVYLMFYLGMAIQMTWLFFWATLGVAVLAGMWATHLVNSNQNSGRAVFMLMGILSFLTVCLGGYVREASRPRFVSPAGDAVAGMNRIPSYDRVYAPRERAGGVEMNMVLERPAYVDAMPRRGEWVTPSEGTPADLISQRCITCHTLERMRRYAHQDWDRVVGRMRAYGTRLSDEEAETVTRHLREGKPY